ncbi:MAG: TetR/AcrR family transcriptional regulator [Acidobacteriota bacterium]
MGKGEDTRTAILDQAVGLASRVGLSGLTIGKLADALGLSKSGLFAHFQSKEALQVQTLGRASHIFVRVVVRPALAAPRGEPRIRAIFDRWLGWTKTASLPGGCLFVAVAAELDDRPGIVRDRLVALQKEWLELIANVVRTGIDEKHFRADLDVDQFAHDLYAVMLGYHHSDRLLRDPRSEDRARFAFDSLLQLARRRRRRRAA